MALKIRLQRYGAKHNPTYRVVVAEAFVYAPEKKKRDLIRRLEASLYTLELPQEQYSLIDTDIEEEEKNKN